MIYRGDKCVKSIYLFCYVLQYLLYRKSIGGYIHDNCITWQSCSGKTTTAKKLEEEGYTRMITYTTRSPRVGEIDGVIIIL